MADEDFDLDNIERRMKGAVEALRKEFGGLRTGRASVSLLEPVTVEVYGSAMPINQVGTVSVPEPRMLSVSVWDSGNVQAVDKAIREAGLGLNPIIDGTTLRLPIPDMTEERRKEMTKLASKYTEQARVAIRNVRRDGMDQIKKSEKDGDMSEDEAKEWGNEVQELTDSAIKQADTLLAEKEKEIMQV